jgi:hypothetical protein
VFFGPVTGRHSANEADVILQGEALNDEFGSSVAGGSDVNGDGIDDLLVGAAQFFGGSQPPRPTSSTGRSRDSSRR